MADCAVFHDLFAFAALPSNTNKTTSKQTTANASMHARVTRIHVYTHTHAHAKD